MLMLLLMTVRMIMMEIIVMTMMINVTSYIIYYSTHCFLPMQQVDG